MSASFNNCILALVWKGQGSHLAVHWFETWYCCILSSKVLSLKLHLSQLRHYVKALDFTAVSLIIDPQREKTYLLTCAPNEDSNQPAHSRNLIRFFALRVKKLCTLGYRKCAQWRFRSACACAQAPESSLGAHVHHRRYIFWRCASIYCCITKVPGGNISLFRSVWNNSVNENIRLWSDILWGDYGMCE